MDVKKMIGMRRDLYSSEKSYEMKDSDNVRYSLAITCRRGEDGRDERSMCSLWSPNTNLARCSLSIGLFGRLTRCLSPQYILTSIHFRHLSPN